MIFRNDQGTSKEDNEMDTLVVYCMALNVSLTVPFLFLKWKERKIKWLKLLIGVVILD